MPTHPHGRGNAQGRGLLHLHGQRRPAGPHIPSRNEYLKVAAEKIDPYGAELYRYLNFDQIDGFEDSGRVLSTEEEAKVLAGV